MMHAGYPGQRMDTRTTVDCKYYLEGRCANGDKCAFRHHPDKFNTASRVGIVAMPHSLPQNCHFYMNGQCNKGDSCAFQHPVLGVAPPTARVPAQPQEDEMNIEFDDDESPKQPQQQLSGKTATPQSAPAPAQQAQVRKQLQQAPSQPSRLQPAAQHPLQSRLGSTVTAQKRLNGLSGAQQQPRQQPAAMQDGADQGKGSVFDRLGGAKPASAATRLSNSAQSVGNARQTSGTLATPGRPVNARDAVVNSVQSIARLGRQGVESVTPANALRRSVAHHRQSTDDLEPVSVSGRANIASALPSRLASTPGLHAPKRTVIPGGRAPQDTPGSRKSALERLARPQQNGSPATSSMNSPAMASKPRRITMEPYTTARSRTSSAQPSQATPSAQPPAQSKEAAERGQSAATTAPAALSKEATDRNQGDASTTAPAAQQSAPVADRRGRPRIQWQPPTQAQAEEAVRESRLSVSKRKAQDPASRAAEGGAALADDPSPPKRMKASTNTTADVPTEQVMQQPVASAFAQQPTAVPASLPQVEPESATGADEVQPGSNDVPTASTSLQEEDAVDPEEDDEFVDDFDDEAAMAELDALT